MEMGGADEESSEGRGFDGSSSYSSAQQAACRKVWLQLVGSFWWWQQQNTAEKSGARQKSNIGRNGEGVGDSVVTGEVVGMAGVAEAADELFQPSSIWSDHIDKAGRLPEVAAGRAMVEAAVEAAALEAAAEEEAGAGGCGSVLAAQGAASFGSGNGWEEAGSLIGG